MPSTVTPDVDELAREVEEFDKKNRCGPSLAIMHVLTGRNLLDDGKNLSRKIRDALAQKGQTRRSRPWTSAQATHDALARREAS